MFDEPDLVCTNKFHDQKEANNRLLGTVVLHKVSGDFCEITKVVSEEEVLASFKGFDAIVIPVKNLDTKAPTLGLFGFNGDAFGVYRSPTRQYSRGLPYRDIRIYSMAAQTSDSFERTNFRSISRNLLFSEAFTNMLKNVYPNTAETIRAELALKPNSFPVSRKLWVKIDQNFKVAKLYYENTGILLFDEKGNRWDVDTNSSLNTFVQTKYKDLISTLMEVYRV